MIKANKSTAMQKRNDSQISKGYIFCRYRRVKNSDRYLDAHDYGYDAWRIPIKK